jgi:opacity protein-like surface antigen
MRGLGVYSLGKTCPIASPNTNKWVTISNTYLSLTLKPHFPLSRRFQLYFGVGADVYDTYVEFKGTYSGRGASTSLNNSDNKMAVGFHGLPGTELLLFEKPFEKKWP